MNEIVKQELPDIIYNTQQIAMIKDMYAKNATDDELSLLMYMSKKYNLDILTKQIWCVKFDKQPAQIYAGRDGFLDIAHRTGMFDGLDTQVERIDEPFSVRYKAYNEWKEFKTDYQYKATTTVYRKDMSHPVYVTVYEEEYSTGRNLWTSKRRTMIGKVAESQALRKAFSISGLYSPEEMGQWEEDNKGTPEIPVEPIKPPSKPLPQSVDTKPPSPKKTGSSDDFWADLESKGKMDRIPFWEWQGKKATPKIVIRMHAIAKEKNIPSEEFIALAKAMVNKESEKEFTYRDLKEVFDYLESYDPDAKPQKDMTDDEAIEAEFSNEDASKIQQEFFEDKGMKNLGYSGEIDLNEEDIDNQ